MSRRSLATGIVVAVLAAGAFVACSEESPAAPDTMHHGTGEVAAVTLDPFTFRGTLDPYRIHQPPDFMIHSKARSASSSSGACSRAPAPDTPIRASAIPTSSRATSSYRKYSKKDGCSETQV